jgi:muramidase (phage lysozyme)
MRDRAPLQAALQHTNVQAFSFVVRNGESSADDRAYHMRYGGAGKPVAYFEDLSAHPHIFELTPSGQKSSAAGAYQATWTTWSEEQARWGWTSFGKEEQDEFFVARLMYRGALAPLIAGNFAEACRLCKAEWTSLPGGAEENRATSQALAVYQAYGGQLIDDNSPRPAQPEPAAPSQEVGMAPILLPLLQAAATLIPQLGSLFADSDVAKRNVAAGQIMADTLVKATESVNLQDAVEKIQNDPRALSAAKQAVSDVLPTITEAGGGGLDGARKYSADANALPWWKQPAFIFFLSILPLVYMLASSVLFGLGGTDWATEVKVMVATAIVGIIAMGGQYFLGSSFSSAKKDNALLAGK